MDENSCVVQVDKLIINILTGYIEVSQSLLCMIPSLFFRILCLCTSPNSYSGWHFISVFWQGVKYNVYVHTFMTRQQFSCRILFFIFFFFEIYCSNKYVTRGNGFSCNVRWAIVCYSILSIPLSLVIENFIGFLSGTIDTAETMMIDIWSRKRLIKKQQRTVCV